MPIRKRGLFIIFALLPALSLPAFGAKIHNMPEATVELVRAYYNYDYSPLTEITGSSLSDFQANEQGEKQIENYDREVSAIENRPVFTQEQAVAEMIRLINEKRMPNYVLGGKGKYRYQSGVNAVIPTANDLNLRSQPNAEARITAVLYVGEIAVDTYFTPDVLDYLGEWTTPRGETWVAVAYNEAGGTQLGWIEKRDVVLIMDSQVAEVVERIKQSRATATDEKVTEVPGGALTDEDFLKLCKSGRARQIENALKAGTNVNAKDDNGMTALMLAARRGCPEVVAALLDAGADVNAKAGDGFFKNQTALMWAVWHNRLNDKVILALIHAGVDVNVKVENDVFKGETALMRGARRGTPEIVAALLDAGADVTARDRDGRTAVDFARWNDKLRDTDILKRMEFMFSVAEAAANESAFIRLCEAGSAQQIVEAIRAGANVNPKNKYGWTPLIVAAWKNGNPEAVTALINAGADVNAKDGNGRTALMRAAASNSNPGVLDVLLRSGADIGAKDRKGKTAWDYARENKNPDIYNLLEAAENAKESEKIATTRRAAESGDAEAQYRLGLMYTKGDCVEEDQWEAVEWLRRAANQGHRLARNELAKRGIYE